MFQFCLYCFSRLCGSLGYYDVGKEKKISLKLPQPLQVYDRIFHKVTTTDDPIIREVHNLHLFDVDVHISLFYGASSSLLCASILCMCMIIITSDHCILFQLTKSPECRDCKVFATDAILATLMTCARSKYSWDIVVYREGDYLFFDKRDTSQFGELKALMVTFVYSILYP